MLLLLLLLLFLFLFFFFFFFPVVLILVVLVLVLVVVVVVVVDFRVDFGVIFQSDSDSKSNAPYMSVPGTDEDFVEALASAALVCRAPHEGVGQEQRGKTRRQTLTCTMGLTRST